VYTFITDMMFYPADYGFTEPTELCIDDEPDLTDPNDLGPWCSRDIDMAAEYVHWDAAHKTTRVHH
jgi:phospholipase/lecithinase/hemolysin